MLQNKTKRERVGVGRDEIGLAMIVVEGEGGKYTEDSLYSCLFWLSSKFSTIKNSTKPTTRPKEPLPPASHLPQRADQSFPWLKTPSHCPPLVTMPQCVVTFWFSSLVPQIA